MGKSQVFTFRLNRDNDDEARALDVLAKWTVKGFILRQTVTKALIALDAGPQVVGGIDDSPLVDRLAVLDGLIAEQRALNDELAALRDNTAVLAQVQTVLEAAQQLTENLQGVSIGQSPQNAPQDATAGFSPDFLDGLRGKVQPGRSLDETEQTQWT